MAVPVFLQLHVTLFIGGETFQLASLSTSSEWQRKEAAVSAQPDCQKQTEDDMVWTGQAAEQAVCRYQGPVAVTNCQQEKPSAPHRKSQRAPEPLARARSRHGCRCLP